MEILTHISLNISLRVLKTKAGNLRTAVDLAHTTYGKSLSKGGAPPVVALHGLLSTKKVWVNICQTIADNTQRTVIAADMRNHGLSPFVATHTYPELASDVSRLLAKHSIRQAVLLGHSMGGRTSMVLALTEPAKVSQLVVIDISPVSTPAEDMCGFAKIIDIMESLSFEGQNSVEKARAAAKEKIEASGIVKNVDSLNFIFKKIGPRPGNKIGWMVNVPALKKHLATIASFPSELKGKTFPGPTLFIGGGKSNFIPPSDLPGIKRYFPAVELKYVPGAGHSLQADNPTAFHKLVTSFLKK